MTGELSKLLDEIKLCQEKDYSFEDLCHTISDHYLDNLSKISEEELGKNGSQSVVSKGGMKTMCLSLPVQYIHVAAVGFGALASSAFPLSDVSLHVVLSRKFVAVLFTLPAGRRDAVIDHM